MKVVRGKVVLKDTGAGVAGVVALVEGIPVGESNGSVVADVPAAGGHAIALGSAAAVAVAPSAVDVANASRAGIGSQATAEDGGFLVEYDDGGEGKPMLLRLSILAPDEPGSSLEARTLYSSTDLRLAGPSEEYIVALPADTLTKAGVPLPPDPSLATQQAQADAVIARLHDKVGYYAAVGVEARNVAASLVADARTAAGQVDAAIQEHLIPALTGISADEAARLNVVAPGADAEPVVWSTVNRTIEKKVNGTTVAGYVVLSEAEAQQFRDANGNYKTDIPGPEIEPYIFQVDPERRPVSILRSDPLAALCRTESAPDPLATATAGDGATAATNGQPPADEPIAAADLPKFVGRLVAPMRAPEDGADGIAPRPTEGDVQASVQGLQLNGGPADVTAYYDFHQLQIAFDYVWQQAIDAGAIDTAKTLCRMLADQGGDPVSALQGSRDPIAALRDEVRFVATAKQSITTGGVAYALAPNGRGSNGDGQTKTPPPKVPHRPSIVQPVFVGTLSVDPGSNDTPEPGDLLQELEQALGERYTFEVFAPGSVNFGLLITYRQRWDPITYQVGNLAKTLTLAPKETRKVTSKRTVKTERSVKEMEDNQRNRKDETSSTMRDEAEIVRKAQSKTSFSLTAHGSYDIGISDGDVTTTLGRDAESSSAETKKQFHEAVLKASQEFKDERKLEVETKVTDETETTDSLELTNPNDELTVTYLFYELQRRFRVSEHIHKLTPVVLVALDVPNPNRDEIDMVLLKHAWIINRVLLDDRYRPALDYLTTRIVGDEMALQHLEQNVQQVWQAVQELKTLHQNMELQLQAREAGLQAAIEARAGAVAHKDTEGVLDSLWDDITGSSSASDPQAAQIMEDAAKDAYERAVQEEKDLRMRLDAETAAYSAANEALAKAQAEHGNRLLQIAALRAHFKENVLYYMQAIWSFTFRDQTFFSLCNVKVPKLTAAQKSYSLKVPDQMPLSIAPKPGQVVLEVDANVELDTNLDPQQDFSTLAEVANLDAPLGFKGNSIIFPLAESNPLTDFMMIPYLDSELGLHDPDELGGWTPEDFAQYARCLVQQEKDTLSESDLAALESQLTAQYKSIVSNPALTTDMVVVPTSSLYIEALPGAHPLLENFKLEHRAIDVMKAKAETRKLELENLRYAARIINTELGDPDFDKQVLIEGVTGVTVNDA